MNTSDKVLSVTLQSATDLPVLTVAGVRFSRLVYVSVVATGALCHTDAALPSDVVKHSAYTKAKSKVLGY